MFYDYIAHAVLEMNSKYTLDGRKFRCIKTNLAGLYYSLLFCFWKRSRLRLTQKHSLITVLEVHVEDDLALSPQDTRAFVSNRIAFAL